MNFNKNTTKLIAVYVITRPVNIIITFISIVIAAVICSNGIFVFNKIIFASASGALAAAAGNIINDLFDIEIDKINRPDRPLPSGALTRSEAVLLYLLFSVISLALSCFINRLALIIDTSSLILLFFYSYKLKRIILLGNFIVALLTGLAFIYGGVSVDNLKYAFIPAVFALLINFIREMVKDMEDIEGDKSAGVYSFPYLFGFKSSKRVITVFSLLLIIATFIPFLSKLYKIEYFIIIMILVNPILIYSLNSLFKDDKIKNLNKISFMLKLDMLFGLIAIFFGK
jgi:geranylgeranylglycerol-phosphate geranylgeranyltransferase